MADLENHNHDEDSVLKRLSRGGSSTGGKVPDQDRNSCKKGWFWSVAVPVILIVGVILPLALTVVKQQQELAALANPKPSIKSTTAAAVASRDQTPPECHDMIPKGPSPLGNPPPPLKIFGSRIVTGKGTDVTLKGINWFGFNNGKTMVDGLDAGNSTWIAADFATVVYRLKLLGFNAVRLPFSFNDLDLPTVNYARSCSPSAPDSQSIAAATIQLEATKGRVPELPEEFVLPVASASGTCNAYLPNGPSTLPRYLWVIQYLVANGMYVMIDYHPHLKELEYLSDPDTFARKWWMLWTAITCLPNYQTDLKGRIMLDLLNEPDEYNLGWAGGRQGRKFKPQGHYLLAAMDMIEGTSPGEPIFLIQGGGQVTLGTAWGDGFVTDADIIRNLRLDDPRPFFKELLTKTYRKRTVLSPHFYGMTVTNNTYTGPQLWEKFTQSWGTLQATGFCHDGDCQRFPVVLGEVGSYLRNPMDLQQLQDMAAYTRRVAPTDEQRYMHSNVSGWFWFCYNANSKDTGGLVGDDWQTLVWRKLTWLFTNLELTPWWEAPAHTYELEGYSTDKITSHLY